MAFNPAPLELAEVLDPAWLDAVLARTHPGASVESARIVETQKTMATKVRFTVDYREGTGAGAPRAFCVKGFFGPDSRPAAGTGGSESEALYYREVGPVVPVRVPPCVYAGIDPATRHGLILMHDLIASGSRFLTALEPYSVQQAGASLEQLARLHSACWDGRRLERWPWLKSKLEQLVNYQAVPAEALQALLEGKRGDPLPAEIRDGKRIYRALAVLAGRSGEERQCVVHGDAHAGNVFETDEGPGLIDWQLLQRGCWALDVGYHIAAALTVDERERSERELLRHYLECLRANRVEPPGWDEAWLRYRSYLLYGYFLWGITRRVAEPVINEFVRRLGTAVAAHRSFELLDV